MLVRYLVVLFAGSFIVGFKAQSSFGFSIKPTQTGATQNYQPTTDYYLADGTKGTVFLDPQKVSSLTRGGTVDFLKTLTQAFPETSGWFFKTAETDLEGNFSIEAYTADFRKISDNGKIIEAVGAEFLMEYIPLGKDPKFGLTKEANTLYWIQRIVNNHAIKSTVPNPQDLGHGTRDDKIDITYGQNNPFYTTNIQFQQGSNYFYDLPSRDDPKHEHEWWAELYLVSLKNPLVDFNNPKEAKEVTIYNGIKWGWKNTVTSPKSSYLFSDSLAAGWETDNFLLNGLTPGASFSAWIDNNLTTNQCNPNTLLSAYHPSGFGSGYDDNSSPVGDGFASAVSGIIGRDGIINFSVQAATPGARGEDRGNYNLHVNVYEAQKSPPPEVPEFNIVGGSGGGGVGNETPGRTQQNPILPNTIDQQGWQIFSNVPGCRWYDPPTTYGFEFQALENTLFTEILDFPFGDDNLFTVSTGNRILGEFSPGQNVDFVSLLGGGVKSFNITGIDSIFGPTQETAFPIQLAFNKNTGSFKMRPISQPKSVPEPHSIFGLFTLLLWACFQGLKITQSKLP